MAPAVEIATIPLLAGTDVVDPSGPSGAVWLETLQTISRREGAEGIYWGRRLETPDTIDMVITWRDIEDHRAFMADSTYGDFVRKIAAFCSAPPELFHVELSEGSDLEAAVGAPITELLTCFTSASADPAGLETAKSAIIDRMALSADGYLGYASGWAIEEAEQACFAAEGGKGKRYLALVGWQTHEAHMQYRGTPLFQETIPLLRQNVKGLGMHHAQFQKH